MLKNILNLEGVAVLSKVQQKSINGGINYLSDGSMCPQSQCASNSECTAAHATCEAFSCDKDKTYNQCYQPRA
jgi:hypothetical protein